MHRLPRDLVRWFRHRDPTLWCCASRARARGERRGFAFGGRRSNGSRPSRQRRRRHDRSRGACPRHGSEYCWRLSGVAALRLRCARGGDGAGRCPLGVWRHGSRWAGVRATASAPLAELASLRDIELLADDRLSHFPKTFLRRLVVRSAVRAFRLRSREIEARLALDLGRGCAMEARLGAILG